MYRLYQNNGIIFIETAKGFHKHSQNKIHSEKDANQIIFIFNLSGSFRAMRKLLYCKIVPGSPYTMAIIITF
jgi:hypothetical protein